MFSVKAITIASTTTQSVWYTNTNPHEKLPTQMRTPLRINGSVSIATQACCRSIEESQFSTICWSIRNNLEVQLCTKSTRVWTRVVFCYKNSLWSISTKRGEVFNTKAKSVGPQSFWKVLSWSKANQSFSHKIIRKQRYLWKLEPHQTLNSTQVELCWTYLTISKHVMSRDFRRSFVCQMGRKFVSKCGEGNDHQARMSIRYRWDLCTTSIRGCKFYEMF